MAPVLSTPSAQVERLRAMLAERHIELEVSEEALDLLAEHGHDPAYGARPLKRTIQRELQNPLAKGILAGEFHGGQTVRVERAGEDLALKATERQAVGT